MIAFVDVMLRYVHIRQASISVVVGFVSYLALWGLMDLGSYAVV
jgi:hypothetical protein